MNRLRCKGEYDTVRTLPWTALNEILEQKGQYIAAGIKHIQLWTGRGECTIGRREKIILNISRSQPTAVCFHCEWRARGATQEWMQKRRPGRPPRADVGCAEGDDSRTCGRLFRFEVNCQRQRRTIQSLSDPQVYPPTGMFARSDIRVATRTLFAQSEPHL